MGSILFKSALLTILAIYKYSSMKILLLLLGIASSFISLAQLELKEIMKGNEFIGFQPENPQWSANGQSIYFDWNPENEAGMSTYQFNTKTEKITKVKKEELSTVYYAKDVLALNNSSFLLKDGNLFSYNKKTNAVTPILETEDFIYDAVSHPELNALSFVQNANLYIYNHTTKGIKQLTNFKKGKKPTAASEEHNFLAQQQIDLFQYIRINKEQQEHKKAQSKAKKNELSATYIGDNSVSNLALHPSGSKVFFRLNTYPKNIKTQTEYHITENGYAEIKEARPKVGSKDPTHKMGYIDLIKDTTVYLDFNYLSGSKKRPEFELEYNANATELKQAKNSIIHGPYFGEKTVFEVKSYDNKDRWICILDENDSIIEIDHQHDDAWIGGPGISSWNMIPGNIGFINNGRTVYYQSEKSGFSHLYLYNISNKKTTQLTNGNFEIHDVILSKNKDKFYVSANKLHPGNREYYKLNFEGKFTPIFAQEGNHDVILHPTEKKAIIRYSSKTKPWELYTSALEENAKLSQITSSTSEAFNKYDWINPKIVSFTANDKEKIYARLYTPLKANRNGASILFVHGAGYLQNAHNWWSGYYREYMFHNLLVEQGYTVLDIDYRASKGYGRDFRTAIYRHMGGKDLSDQIDGKKYLVDSLGLDPNRVGIYGGSYGGFITLMALLTTPGEFKAGAAIRSVTDWAHYNHAYTSNILNTPKKDPLAFKRSSPIYFAEQLEDHLLMLHGMVDDNVQFMDITRLSQRFIELGKQNWELAVYPVEPHGFKQTSSWIDEYSRILKLFNRTLLK